MRWQFWIDRGGTFTDCLGRDPVSGVVKTAKVLSSDRAPLVGIRQLLGISDDQPIPPCEIRMGTTLATNALLERHGADCALVITRGFGDLLAIGNQTRPHIFDLDIRKPQLLYNTVIEVDARYDASGQVIQRPDLVRLEQDLRKTYASGIDSLAVVVMHAYHHGQLEQDIAAVADSIGFSHVSLSAEVAAEIGMVGRGDTTVVDAYLTPLIRTYVATLLAELPGSSLRIMQSSGGLTQADTFRGRNAIFSGPAAGVVAYAHVAKENGYAAAIGFDMGGTSTDVSCYEGDFEREYETEVAGVRLRAPMLAIHTVAAGGGSICRYNGFRFTVGPESSGAIPGPLCYGHMGAVELTLTDVNLALGRVVGDRFPFELDPHRVEQSLVNFSTQLRDQGIDRSSTAIAAGLFAIANANMAEAIRQVSVAKGRDVRDYALVVFGGAGGQHACAIARQLGIRTLIFDRYAGVLSAYGMGLADVTWHNEADAGRQVLDAAVLLALVPKYRQLIETSRQVLLDEGFAKSQISARQRIDLRYQGTDTMLTLDWDSATDVMTLTAAFHAAHRQLFGYQRLECPVEAVTIRVEAIGYDASLVRSTVMAAPSGLLMSQRNSNPLPVPLRMTKMWTGEQFESVSVYSREALCSGTELSGPALILEAIGTIALDPGFKLTVGANQQLIIQEVANERVVVEQDDHQADPILLEIFNNLFMSIATQMGDTLRRTAVSTNIRERLDFSCAVFDREGGLVANAPHIPVHLGAMSEAIKGLLAQYPHPVAGGVFASNDPVAGGSHLPDVTVITPVHDGDGELLFFTASRGHHADIGGITPGSMPPFSTQLEQEGVVFRALPIVTDGVFNETRVMEVLNSGRYPARNPHDNVADLQAQIAANQSGVSLLHALVERHGQARVMAYMQHIQDNAAAQVASEIAELDDGDYQFADALDDGTPVCVAIKVQGDHMLIDFSGTGAEVPGNLNAPRAVTLSAVIYVLRLLVGTAIPLNSGCLRPVTVIIPAGSLLAPSAQCAVVGGNVETSQRVVDVLLGALGKAAASQGTMNNLTFGTANFGYYETIAGGAGATSSASGASGVHTHMTNTRITDPEVLEARFPVRLQQFSLRRHSGGEGKHSGGDGVIREFELLVPMQVSILSERRQRSPFGMAGGAAGHAGRNLHNGHDVGGKASFEAQIGDHIRVETPGGGGYGQD